MATSNETYIVEFGFVKWHYFIFQCKVEMTNNVLSLFPNQTKK